MNEPNDDPSDSGTVSADRDYWSSARIRVIGVGPWGAAAVRYMLDHGLEDVDGVLTPPDVAMISERSFCSVIRLDPSSTWTQRRDGISPLTELTRIETREPVGAVVRTSDLVFLVVDLGNPNDVHTAITLGELLRARAVPVIGVVARPFPFAGSVGRLPLDQPSEAVLSAVDSLLVLPGKKAAARLGQIRDPHRALDAIRESLLDVVRSITEAVTCPGLIGVDFSDVLPVFVAMGRGVVGCGTGSGDYGARDAAEAAFAELWAESDLRNVRGLLVNISGGLSLPISALHQASAIATRCIQDQVFVTTPCCIRPELQDEIRVTVIATGLRSGTEEQG